VSHKPAYTDDQRREATSLVLALRVANPQRQKGAIASAARHLHISANAIGRWLLERDLRPATTGAPPPPDLRFRRGMTPLAPLVNCGSCGRNMSHHRTAVTGTPVFQCPPGCRRRDLVPVPTIERLIGEMILRHVSPANPTYNQMTAETALWRASRILTRIIIGMPHTDLRVRWRSVPILTSPRPLTVTLNPPEVSRDRQLRTARP
jgi:hypothetical protein